MLLLKLGRSIEQTLSYLYLVFYCLVLFLLGIAITILSAFWGKDKHNRVLEWYHKNKPVIVRFERGLVGVKDVKVCNGCSNKFCATQKTEVTEPQRPLSPAFFNK